MSDITNDDYSSYQLYREKQRASYLADSEVVSLDDYKYEVDRRDQRIKDLQYELERALTKSRNVRAELDAIKSTLLVTGVIHDRDEPVCLSDKVSWIILERQEYRINEIGLQVQELP